MILWNKCGFL